ncbi:MAG: hypothetical protein JSV03_02725 [Planctomycetota bacterium]|nr:MAG: hypothetical protein JSV03_02725 [Planctomycetota bacterium]
MVRFGLRVPLPPNSCMFGISNRAIIDVADSLIAVKKLVYEDKKLTVNRTHLRIWSPSCKTA